MFTATITSKNFNEGVMQVLVTFNNGTKTVSKAFNVLSERNLNGEIESELKRLNELEIFAVALQLGAYNVPQDTGTSLTQDELDKRKWFRDFNKLDHLTRLNTLGGLRPALGADLDALRATVSADFKKAYIADM